MWLNGRRCSMHGVPTGCSWRPPGRPAGGIPGDGISRTTNCACCRCVNEATGWLALRRCIYRMTASVSACIAAACSFWARTSGITRTEYVDFPAHPEKRAQILAAVLEFVADELAFDEFVLADIRRDTPTRTQLSAFAASRGWWERPSNVDQGMRIELAGDYTGYLAGLGRNTRLRLHNRRKVLESLGDVAFFRYTKDRFASAFGDMDRLFHRRWGKPVCNPSQLDFHRCMAERLPDSGNVQLTGLSIDGRVVSVQYGIRLARTEYNLLSGFHDGLHPKLSVGMLHFGYSIEQAYRDGLRYYDLLLGPGRSTRYKRYLAGQTVEAETVQFIRRPLLKAAYSVYDRLTARKR